MIARRTILSLCLALLFGGGIWAWVLDHPDACARYPGANGPQTQEIEVENRTVSVPCSAWLPRQSPGLLAACLVEVALAVVFLVYAMLDLLRPRTRPLRR